MSSRTGATRCPGHSRHWFTPYGTPGVILPECVRCGAPNPNWTIELESRRVDLKHGCHSCGVVGGHVRGCYPFT